MDSAISNFAERYDDLSLKNFYVSAEGNDLLNAIRCVILNKEHCSKSDLYLKVVEKTKISEIGRVVTVRDEFGSSTSFIVKEIGWQWRVTEINGALAVAPDIIFTDSQVNVENKASNT